MKEIWGSMSKLLVKKPSYYYPSRLLMRVFVLSKANTYEVCCNKLGAGILLVRLGNTMAIRLIRFEILALAS